MSPRPSRPDFPALFHSEVVLTVPRTQQSDPIPWKFVPVSQPFGVKVAEFRGRIFRIGPVSGVKSRDVNVGVIVSGRWYTELYW